MENLEFQFFGAVFTSKGYPFKNIFDFTTAHDWDCVAALERLLALHYSVDIIFLSFGWLVGFVALRPKSTAMVIAGRSVHLITLFLGRLEQAVNQ